jgi:hypothetical protein
MDKLSKVVGKVFTENPHIVKDAKEVGASFPTLYTSSSR